MEQHLIVQICEDPVEILSLAVATLDTTETEFVWLESRLEEGVDGLDAVAQVEVVLDHTPHHAIIALCALARILALLSLFWAVVKALARLRREREQRTRRSPLQSGGGVLGQLAPCVRHDPRKSKARADRRH